MHPGVTPRAEGWYHDPTGRHELRWFSDGTPTKLVRDATYDSTDALSPEERALPATSGPGLVLPERATHLDDRYGPADWWDTSVPQPGEPTLKDIGLSGVAGYELIREIRMINRLGQRRPRRFDPVLRFLGFVQFAILLSVILLFIAR